MGTLVIGAIDMGTLLIGGLIGHLVNVSPKTAASPDDQAKIKAAFAKFDAKVAEFRKCCLG